MSVATGRYSNSKAILGDDLFNKVQDSRVLVVGAGGIGCELIKNMVMTGFGGSSKGLIEVLDLDTIDLSNLNRQFLFQKQHVKRPKAVVARETALKFNPNVNIKALHRNIKDAEFNVDYFKSFDFVLNALDNLDARRHVNKMCLAANIPLIESGTSGYVGQVQPIKKDLTECFDCTGKPVPKTFAVCTIRSTPSTAHHCIAWSKSYLFPQLFGADEDSEDLDEAEKNGENVEEIQNLRKEAAAIKTLRSTLTESSGAAQRIFQKVYTEDISRLLLMEDMWKHRSPPHCLSWDELSKHDVEVTSATAEGAKAEASGSAGVNGSAGKIESQRELSLKDSFNLFISSVERLSARIDPNTPLVFDKDDEDTLDFVVASANLRASAFGIESQTRFQVKEYAGNIIPAIATTNAIIAGVLVLQSLNILRNSWKSSKMIWLSRQSTKIFSNAQIAGPNPYCSVCRVIYLPLNINSTKMTLGQFIDEIVIGEVGFEGHVTVMESSRLLWETEDFEDNKGKSMEELGLGEGTFVNVLDDDEDSVPIIFSISSSLPLDSTKSYILGAPIPSPIPKKAPPPIPEPEDEGDDDVVEIGAGALGEEDDIIIVEENSTSSNGNVGGKKRTADEAKLEGVDEEKQDGKKSKKEGEEEEGLMVVE